MDSDMALANRHFLGVERSATGRAWTSRLADERLALAIAQREGLPEIIARVLAGRGVAPEDCAAWRHLLRKLFGPSRCLGGGQSRALGPGGANLLLYTVSANC